jgi:acetyltransferase-like isoleucine patch superfamily enzyme
MSVDPRKELARLQNPPLQAWWRRRKQKQIQRNMDRLLRELPNVRIGANIHFASYRNVSVVAQGASLELGSDIWFFAEMMMSVFEYGQLKMGHSCIWSGGRIACRHRITIGDRVMAGQDVFIEDYEGHPADPVWRSKQVDWMVEKRAGRVPTPTHSALSEKEAAFFDKYPFTGMPPAPGIAVGEVVIGNNVWIGRGSKIRKGVKIGNNCIIATGSVVTKDIPDNWVAGGIPAKPIKEMELRDFNALMDEMLAAYPDYAADNNCAW